MSQIITELVEQARVLKIKAEERRFQILDSRLTEEYISLGETIKEAQERMKEIEGRNEYEAQLSEVLQKLRTLMEAQKVNETEGAKLKFRTKKKVNASAVRAVLNDDDQFMSLIDISQSKLKDFSKNIPGLKKPLESCVQIVSRDITGVELTE